MKRFFFLAFYFGINIGLAYLADHFNPGHGKTYWFVMFCAMDGVLARAELASKESL